MDEIDQAQATEADWLERQARAALDRPPEVPLERDGVRVCLDCEEDIHAARLAAYPQAVRCWPCQTMHERAHGGRR